jgi:hypothetical protein
VRTNMNTTFKSDDQASATDKVRPTKFSNLDLPTSLVLSSRLLEQRRDAVSKRD